MLKKKSLLPLLLTAAFLSTVFFLFILLTGQKVALSVSDIPLTTLLFSVLYFFVCIYFLLQKNDDIINLVFIWAVAAALIYMRVALLSFPSRDYNVFLSKWLAEMREMKGVEPLVKKIGDYNMPYLYFLFIISKLNLNDLILIKWFSCIFT